MTPALRIEVRPANDADFDDLVELQIGLFEEDAGVHEKLVDLSWPRIHGRADIEDLLSSDTSLVLIAEVDGQAIGFLVGYLASSSPTRLASTSAVLRSLYIVGSHRGSGAGSKLTEQFIMWANSHGAANAQVSAYAANDGAQRFYERHGFRSQSISRTLDLSTD